MTHLESLDVSILFFLKIMKETNFSFVLVCVVFLGMELVKKVIGVMIPLENVFVFLDMWSFGNTKYFTNYLMFRFPYRCYGLLVGVKYNSSSHHRAPWHDILMPWCQL